MEFGVLDPLGLLDGLEEHFSNARRNFAELLLVPLQLGILLVVASIRKVIVVDVKSVIIYNIGLHADRKKGFVQNSFSLELCRWTKRMDVF